MQGSKITAELEKLGMTQRELAKKTGVTESSITRYIQNKRTPRAFVVARMATALHTTSDYLLSDEEICREDSEKGYSEALNAAQKYSKIWSPQEKADLVNAVFGLEH